MDDWVIREITNKLNWGYSRRGSWAVRCGLEPAAQELRARVEKLRIESQVWCPSCRKGRHGSEFTGDFIQCQLCLEKYKAAYDCDLDGDDLGLLFSSPDSNIMPVHICDALELPQGSTYKTGRQAVQQ